MWESGSPRLPQITLSASVIRLAFEWQDDNLQAAASWSRRQHHLCPLRAGIEHGAYGASAAARPATC
jgi:hypothetical protein